MTAQSISVQDLLDRDAFRQAGPGAIAELGRALADELARRELIASPAGTFTAADVGIRSDGSIELAAGEGLDENAARACLLDLLQALTDITAVPGAVVKVISAGPQASAASMCETLSPAARRSDLATLAATHVTSPGPASELDPQPAAAALPSAPLSAAEPSPAAQRPHRQAGARSGRAAATGRPPASPTGAATPARPSRRPMMVGIAAIAVAGLGWVAVLSAGAAESTSPAPGAEPASSSSPPVDVPLGDAAAAQPAEPDWANVMARLDLRRTDALQRADLTALVDVNAAQSTAAGRDESLVASLINGKIRPRHLRTVILSAATVTRTPEKVTLAVTDTRAAYSFATLGGKPAGKVPARGAATWTVQLTQSASAPAGWLITDVSPTALSSELR